MDVQVPDTFDDTNDEALAELRSALEAEFERLYDDEAPVPDLSALADQLDKVKAEQTARAEADETEAAERAALADRVRPGDDSDDETETDSEIAADGPDADAADDTDDETDEADEVEAADERELVTASAASAPARRANPRSVARRTQRPSAPPAESTDVVITASADVPGFGNGQTIDRNGIAKALHARARGLGDSKGRRTPHNVASVSMPYSDALTITETTVDPWAVVDEAVRSELEGKDATALVASGGWCAPSETIYDLFSVVSRDGLLDLPSVSVSRGGIMYPDYIGLSAADDALWTWSEANDENPGSDGDATKPCVKIPCPTFSECRLGAEGLCVTHGNLMDRAYPEMTRYFVDLVMTAHLHRMSNAQVAAIIATAEAVTVTSAPSDAAGDILNAIDLQVADYRSEHLMSESVVLEGTFPQWWHGAIRSTLAMRNGVDKLAVSNAEINGYFTTRNVRPQFLAGYDPIYNAAAATAWPTDSTFLLAPAGGYVLADGGSIDLGVVRDSTLNETNDFTAAWSEQFYCVLQRGPAAREVTVTTAVDGQTGGLEFAGAAAV